LKAEVVEMAAAEDEEARPAAAVRVRAPPTGRDDALEAVTGTLGGAGDGAGGYRKAPARRESYWDVIEAPAVVSEADASDESCKRRRKGMSVM
jgi:hypothetical protein